VGLMGVVGGFNICGFNGYMWYKSKGLDTHYVQKEGIKYTL
jgi:hypothetical protein